MSKRHDPESRSRSLLLLCALIIGQLAGCASSPVIVVSGVEVYESHWNATVASLQPRAQFELGCDSAELEFTLLEKFQAYPTMVGAQGCGSKALYMRVIRGDGLGGISFVSDWFIESAARTKLANSPVP